MPTQRSKRTAAAPPAPPTLESVSFRAFLESPRFCNLKLSPVVAAIADAADGAPVTSLRAADCVRVFGVKRLELPRERRRVVTVIAGGQGGKTTRLGAPKAIHAAWTAPSPAGPNARSLIIAPDRDLASTDLEACKMYVWGSPVLRDALRAALSPDRARRVDWDADEYSGPSRFIPLRRPDGSVVEIFVRAGLKRGTSARSRPLVNLLLDEACFFDGEGAAVTDKEILDAALHRLVPGAQAWLVSTPWEEQTGEAMRFVRERDEASDPAAKHRRALVVGGSAEHFVTTLDLRPDWDTSGEIRELLARDPANLAREFQGIPLPSGSSRWFNPAAVAEAFNLAPYESTREGVGVGADFAFEQDSSAQAAVDRHPGDRYDVRELAEQTPSGATLKPSEVCASAAAFTKQANARELCADAHSRASVQEHLHTHGVGFVDLPTGESGKRETYSFTRDLFAEGKLRLAGVVGEMRERIKTQLGQVLKKPRPGGRWEIYVPRRKGMGHGDVVSALVAGVWHARSSALVGRASDLAGANASFGTWAADAGGPPRTEEHGGGVDFAPTF